MFLVLRTKPTQMPAGPPNLENRFLFLIPQSSQLVPNVQHFDPKAVASSRVSVVSE